MMMDPWLWAAIVYGLGAGVAPFVFISRFDFNDDTIARVYYALLWPALVAFLVWEAFRRAWQRSTTDKYA